MGEGMQGTPGERSFWDSCTPDPFSLYQPQLLWAESGTNLDLN